MRELHVLEPTPLEDPADEVRTDWARHYRAHRDAVYRWCLRYGGGRAAWAEDMTHDVFVRLFQRLPALAETDDLGGWLYRVTANLCVSQLRRERSWLRRLVLAGPTGDPGVQQPTPELQGLAREALATLRLIPDRERVAFCMKVLDGKTQREVAHDLGLSEGYVSKLLARAVERIRAAGWECDDERP